MTELSASELARNLSAVLDRLEFGGEEFVVLRNSHPIARLIPGNPHRTAIEALADLHRTISDEAARAWVEEGRLPATLDSQTRDPWVT